MTSPSLLVPPNRLRAPGAVMSALALAAVCGCADGSGPSVDASEPARLFDLRDGAERTGEQPAGDDSLDELLLVGEDAPRFGLVRTPMSHWAQQEYVRRHALVHEDGSSTEFVLDPEKCSPFDQSLWQAGVDIEDSALSGALVDEMLLTVLITSETDRYDGLDGLLDDDCEEVRMQPVTRSADGKVIPTGDDPEQAPDDVPGTDDDKGAPPGTIWFRNVPLETEAPDGVDDYVAVLQFQEPSDEGRNGAENVYIRGVVDEVAVDVSVSSVFGGSVDDISAAAVALFEQQVSKISELH